MPRADLPLLALMLELSAVVAATSTHLLYWPRCSLPSALLSVALLSLMLLLERRRSVQPLALEVSAWQIAFLASVERMGSTCQRYLLSKSRSATFPWVAVELSAVAAV